MTNKKQTAIYLTDEQRALKREIEQSLDGAKISHTSIYDKGLYLLKELMENKVKINLTNVK